MFNRNDAIYIANKLGVSFDGFTIDEFLTGLNIELEHGLINPKTNVTNDSLEMTAKIALAHLNEFPNYYNPNYGITIFEKFLASKLNENLMK